VAGYFDYRPELVEAKLFGMLGDGSAVEICMAVFGFGSWECRAQGNIFRVQQGLKGGRASTWLAMSPARLQCYPRSNYSHPVTGPNHRISGEF
jgi:hypothetical protein